MSGLELRGRGGERFTENGAVATDDAVAKASRPEPKKPLAIWEDCPFASPPLPAIRDPTPPPVFLLFRSHRECHAAHVSVSLEGGWLWVLPDRPGNGLGECSDAGFTRADHFAG